MEQDNKTAMDRQGKRIRRRRFLRRLFIFVCLAFAVGLCLNLFIITKTVKVINNTRYSAADVLSSAEIDTGTPLFSIREGSLRKKLTAEYPYIKNVEVGLELPFSVTLRLTPAVPFLALQKEDGSFYYLDKEKKVLETSYDFYEDTVLVTGMTFEKYSSSKGIIDAEEDIKLGTVMTPEENLEMEIVNDILDMLEQYKLTARLSSIDLSVSYNLSFVLDDSIIVELGTSEDLERKFSMLMTILDRNRGVSSMIINVRDYTKGRCRIIEQ